MFTSRAEYRLLLRQDNADVRLSEFAHQLGLLNETDYARFSKKTAGRKLLKDRLEKTKLTPTPETNSRLKFINQAEIRNVVRLADIVRRPTFNSNELSHFIEDLGDYSLEDLKYIETEIKYEGYLEQAYAQIRQVERLETMPIPLHFKYEGLSGVPHEAIEKLSQLRPMTLGQAGRISGITPATVSVLAIHLSKKDNKIISCGDAQVIDLIEESEGTIRG
jgi:tRNA uridine 5-carboxymethylaminomethyl modification enzyme